MKFFSTIKKMKRIIYLVFFFFQLIIQYGAAQNNDITFNRITNNDGSSLKKITAITQDLAGYMWFSGQGAECLYRYDGKRIKVFKQDSSNSNSLGGTNPETVYADDSGYIWIGFLGTGLDKFNPATGNFRHFRFNANDKNSLANDTVNAIIRDHKGVLWVGTNGGLNRLDEKAGKFIHYTNQPGNQKSLSSNVIRNLYVDHKGVLWVGTGWPFYNLDKETIEGGLNRMEPDETFTRFMHEAKNPNSLTNNKVRSIFEDSRGTFWVGTAGDGLHTMDRSKGIFEHYFYNSKKPDALSRPPLKTGGEGDHITFICEDGAGAIWIGTYASGINRYDTASKKITHYELSNGFPDKTGWMAYTSRDGVLWISTQENNLYRIDPFRKKINNIIIGGNGVGDILEDKQGSVWIGVGEKGLLEYDSNLKLIQEFKNIPSDTFSLHNNIIFQLFQNQKDSIWLCTVSGVEIFNTQNKKFYRLQLNAQYNPHFGFRIFSMLQDGQGIKWFGSINGLIEYYPDGMVKQYLHNAKDSNSISNSSVTAILNDNNNFIWAGTEWNGLNLLNPQTGYFSHYLQGSKIMCLYQDSKGIIWAGTNKGLFSFNKSADKFLPFFNAQSAFSNVAIRSMLEDDFKNLWITTPSFILKIDSARKEAFAYGKEFGIAPNSLGGIFKTSKGQLLITHHSAFYIVYPNDLTAKSQRPQMLVTDFFINDLSVPVGNKSLLAKPLEETKKIELKYDQNNIAFNFAVIDYRTPETYEYSSRLEGFDSTWRIAGVDKNAFYINVPPGKYTFSAKAINSDGVEAVASIQIIILPPWWKTNVAYVLYIICFLIISFFANRIIRNRIIEKERMKSREKELAQAKEIEKAYNELKSTQAQLIQSEKMASLGELTAGIAHEIQNPLNFVNNFSEVNKELVDEMQLEMDRGNYDDAKEISNDIKENEEKINHHGKRADAIVKGMLQHSRSSTGVKEPTNINALADEYLRLAYHGLRAKDKSFNAIMKTDFDESIGKINIVPQDIGRVLLNLYNNAFYAVSEKKKQRLKGLPTGQAGYEPTVSFSSKKMGDKIILTVTDNGNGIPQKVIDKIFQPFFTTKPTGEGTGLGLSLSYDIIKAHGGEIKVETKEGEGSEFIIKLPIT
jgi:signal transduction histidine kinase/ligand-binding sensor domain-containing protein